MWDYVAKTRQDEFLREAEARRLIRRMCVERPSVFSKLRIAFGEFVKLARPHHRLVQQPLKRVQEIHACVDA